MDLRTLRPWRLDGNAVTDCNGNLLFTAHAEDGSVREQHLQLVLRVRELRMALERAADHLHMLGSGGKENSYELRLCYELHAVMAKAPQVY